MVKEGRLESVPKTFTFLEGIWPPELVPLFLRDGYLPNYVDADELEECQKKIKNKKKLIDEKQTLQAAILLSTFANGCLHRSICCTPSTTAESLLKTKIKNS